MFYTAQSLLRILLGGTSIICMSSRYMLESYIKTSCRVEGLPRMHREAAFQLGMPYTGIEMHE